MNPQKVPVPFYILYLLHERLKWVGNRLWPAVITVAGCWWLESERENFGVRLFQVSPNSDFVLNHQRLLVVSHDVLELSDITR
jgi:hypothetical protein